MENATTTYIILKELAGNPPPKLNAIQRLLEPHVATLEVFWTLVWVATALVLIGILLYEHRTYARNK